MSLLTVLRNHQKTSGVVVGPTADPAPLMFSIYEHGTFTANDDASFTIREDRN